ncbi:hypothetical protein ACTGJ9_039565 [Bradyrhizobium sp. RDM12]
MAALIFAQSRDSMAMIRWASNESRGAALALLPATIVDIEDGTFLA